jgi:putative hemin transport protein
MTPTMTTKNLKEAWRELLEENPKMRTRDAAEKLGGGESVTRLEGNFGEMLVDFGRLGRVMALTRNAAVVHERKGAYSRVELMPAHNNMGQVLDEGIDLRLFLNHWRHAFAVEQEKRRSFQFFDAQGTAIHKTFLQPDSIDSAFAEIVEKYRSPNQSTEFHAEAKPAKPAEKPDAEIDIVTFRSRWAAMKDTHEFFGLTREFGVAREQALRLADKDVAFPVERTSYRKILETAAREAMRIMVFVGNDGVIQIHSGAVRKVLPHGEWFNVLDADFNLHIHEPQIARAWVVRKPTVDGIVTSLELYNDAGESVALFFSKRKPGEPESEQWRALLG